MVLADHETTVVAALRLLESGPFWLLALWHRCSPPLQQEIVETLLDEPSFQAALRAARATDQRDRRARPTPAVRVGRVVMTMRTFEIFMAATTALVMIITLPSVSRSSRRTVRGGLDCMSHPVALLLPDVAAQCRQPAEHRDGEENEKSKFRRTAVRPREAHDAAGHEECHAEPAPERGDLRARPA